MLIPLCTTILVVFQFGVCLSENRIGGDGTINLALNPDGSYSFSYDTNTGGFHSQSGSKKQVSGKYGFSGDSGTSLNVEFSRDVGGNGNGNGNKGENGGKSYGSGGGIGGPSYGNGGGGGDNGDTGILTLKLNPDSSYSYSYDLKDQGKSENRDADGEVMGNYYFKGTDGQRRNIDYTAGVGGFQPSGDGIDPIASEDQASESGGYGGGSGGGFSSGSSGGSGGGNGGSNTQDDDTGVLTLSLGPGGVYAYNYELKSQSKSESRTADGKVQGKFDFFTPDGEKKSIQYTADEGGFQPRGDHIPSDGTDANGGFGGSNGGYGSSSDDTGSYDAPEDDSGSNGGSQSYKFSYEAEDHSRQEMREGKGLALGSYSLNAPGHKQQVKYSAGGKQGYEPNVEVKANVGAKSNGQSFASFGGSGSNGGYGGSAGQDELSSGSDDGSSSGSGGSYSFSYNGENHKRYEGGQSGQIQGGYSIGSKTLQQESSYSAGKEGFNPMHSIDIKLGKNGRNNGNGRSY